MAQAACWAAPTLVLLCLLPSLAATEELAPMAMQVREMPYHLSERLEGMYSRFSSRWFGGPTYMRTDAVFRSEAYSTHGSTKTPVFVGPFCTNVWQGPPGIWCFAQCEEDIISETRSLMLPCDLPYPDGTECPKTDDSAAPPAPANSVVCEVLGHAQRWHAAGRSMEAMPPASWWRMQAQEGGFVDAPLASTGLFIAGPHKESSAMPGERFHLRQDGTFRAGARPALCLGAEGGNMRDDTRLVLWDCGRPPYAHEKWQLNLREGSGLLRSSKQPSLCAVTRGGAFLNSMSGSTDGLVLRLGRCDGSSQAGHAVQLFSAEDGTIRSSKVPTLCVRSESLDVPALGQDLQLRRCGSPLPQGLARPSKVAQKPPPHKANGDASVGEQDSKVTEMRMAMEELLGQALENSPRLDRLEQQLLDMQVQMKAPASSSESQQQEEEPWIDDPQLDDTVVVEDLEDALPSSSNESIGTCERSNTSSCT